jgi:hypothetical protein
LGKSRDLEHGRTQENIKEIGTSPQQKEGYPEKGS